MRHSAKKSTCDTQLFSRSHPRTPHGGWCEQWRALWGSFWAVSVGYAPTPFHGDPRQRKGVKCGFSYRRATGVQNLIRTLEPVSKGCASHTRYHTIVHALETFGHPRFAVCRHSGAEYEPPPMHPNVGKSCRHAMTAQRTRVGRMRSHARLPRCPRAGGAAHGRGTHAAPTRAPCLQLSRLGHAAGHCREAVRAGLLHESCEPAHDK